MSVIETASRVLRDEAAAVESLVNKLDGQFEKAVRMIDESKGRVVLTLSLIHISEPTRP